MLRNYAIGFTASLINDLHEGRAIARPSLFFWLGSLIYCV